MSNLNKTFGSPIASQPAEPVATVGQEVTISNGRDRQPGKIAEILLKKDGTLKGYTVQQFGWVQDGGGYAAKILWDDAQGNPKEYLLGTHGRSKGKLDGLYLDGARPFYDLSF